MGQVCKFCDRECRASFVYVMSGRSDGSLKIGYAADAKRRAAQLRRGGVDAQLLHRTKVRCEFVAMDVEDAVHKAVWDKWSGYGEWFFLTLDDAKAAIERAARSSL